MIDGNNVFGSRPDGWWNNPARAMAALAQAVAEWCREHSDEVVLVFDGAVPEHVAALAGGNLTIESAPRRGRDGADDRLVELADGLAGEAVVVAVVVVSSDRGLRARLATGVRTEGVTTFRERVGY